MKAFERSIKLSRPIAQALCETSKPKHPLRPSLVRSFSTAKLTEMSRTPKGDLGKSGDKEKSTTSREVNSEGNSNEKPSIQIKQAIKAFENLPPICEKPISSELTNGMAKFLVEMQNRNPAFETAIRPLLDTATNATSEVSNEEKDNSSPTLEPSQTTSEDTKEKTPVTRINGKSIESIKSDIGDLEESIKRINEKAKEIKEAKSVIDRYVLNEPFKLYNHFLSDGQRIKARYWKNAVLPNMVPFSKEEEKKWLKKYKFEGKVSVIKYAEACRGRHFNCHSYTFTNGEGGWMGTKAVQKILNEADCELIGTNTSDNLKLKKPAQKDDIVVFRQTREEIVAKFKETSENAADLNDELIERQVKQYIEEGKDILHSAFVSDVNKNGEVVHIENTWGILGIYRHKPTDVPPIYGSYYQIYRREGGRLIPKDSVPSYVN